MSEGRSLFSERSQRAILWWGIALAIVYIFAFAFLLQQVPLEESRVERRAGGPSGTCTTKARSNSVPS